MNATPPSSWPNSWPNSSFTNAVQAIHIPSGTRFGKLTVIERGPNIGSNRSMLVRCDCGTEKIVQARYLREEKIKSCGCLRTAQDTYGHRRSDHPFYQIWKNMHARCNNRSHSGYAGCGALGVRVCERWHTFEAFIQDMGPRPPRTVLCRMDELKDYTPENTRWLTAMQKRAIHGAKFR